MAPDRTAPPRSDWSANPLPPTVEADLATLGSLAEPVRRRLYLLVAGSAEPVGRDDAAVALGITRSLAAFHLDRLVADGLLATEFRRRSGRTGPGAGRPAKLYRRAPGTRSVSLPARNYELAAHLFADGLAEGGGAAGRARVQREAFEQGHAIGVRRAGDAPANTAETLTSALAEQGFEPRRDAELIRLGNCPFHALAAVQRDLTCGMNLALLSGVLDGLGATGWQARLDPKPGLCCVAFAPSDGDEPLVGDTSKVAESA
jgi:predicted ArsR family transcriptional regulator